MPEGGAQERDWSGGWNTSGVVTPEAVRLDLEPVGLGSRSIAMLLDLLVLVAIDVVSLVVFSQALPDLGESFGITLAILLLLFNVPGYHLLSELAMDGQTWGKRRARLRVVATDGQPATTSAIVIRNLVRLLDFLPSAYALGALVMATTKRSQRLGDLAAGTIVVQERNHRPPVAVATPSVLPTWAEALDISAVDEQDYLLARGWLQRRHQLAPAAATSLAVQVGHVLRAKVVGVPDGIDDAALIPVVVALVQRGSAR